ncbi:hypothetical protein [Paracidovorax konjaci]|uniref:DUF2946 domain-containing protein n=1 Tax=Paracidovorax konjaci TaxID=32040 RepID=A0A1I1WC27_9BURK|nr:hypothetical protein [Paracidovorax konjaci]SFD92745.1 hypothetical protein SAMN04489710_10937 [Paracidovorax konjaci]
MPRRAPRTPAAAAPLRHGSPRALAVWMWLALALALAPALGRMHQVVHGAAAGPAWVAAAAAKAQAVHAPGRHAGHAPRTAGGGLEALFAGHAGSDCNLLDQSLFGAALLPALLPAAAQAATPAPVSLPQTGIGARPQRTFLARAPPSRSPTRA